ncbi:unnamed protein product, partial [Brugia timori]|uniref:RAD protein (Pv-fam-e) n=1 Tax=Brugia timori TaxID=42155 RepID=A0A0R3R8G2_9BILA
MEARSNNLNEHSSHVCCNVTTADGSQQDERSDTWEQSVLEHTEYSSMQNDLNRENTNNEYETNAVHPSLTEFFQNSRIDAFGFIHSLNNMYIFFNRFINRESAIDLETLRKREKKWLHMLTNWSYFMDNKYEKVRERCRK